MDKLIVGIFVFVLVAAMLFCGSWLIMVAWNYVVPALFHGPVIGFWHAFALWFLLGIIGNAFRSPAKESK